MPWVRLACSYTRDPQQHGCSVRRHERPRGEDSLPDASLKLMRDVLEATQPPVGLERDPVPPSWGLASSCSGIATCSTACTRAILSRIAVVDFWAIGAPLHGDLPDRSPMADPPHCCVSSLRRIRVQDAYMGTSRDIQSPAGAKRLLTRAS